MMAAMSFAMMTLMAMLIVFWMVAAVMWIMVRSMVFMLSMNLKMIILGSADYIAIQRLYNKISYLKDYSFASVFMVMHSDMILTLQHNND